MVTSETKKRLLLSKWRISNIADLREQIDEHKEALADQDDQILALTATLEDVKYWLHDGLVMHRLVSDPRQLLRKVEDVLG